MAKIRISADSTCDLTKEILDEFGITIIPLTVMSGGNAYKDGVDICTEDVFRLTEETGKLCSTSAVNVFDYTETFNKLLADNDDYLVHICISKEFSACYINACSAAKEFGGRVRVIDSRNLSTGMGHIVYEAALMSERGTDINDMENKLNELTSRVEASFVLDTLDYMKRGGRCSAVQAFGASVLKLKPSISVSDGKMTVGETYKGSLDKCLKKYVKERLEGRTDIVTDRIFITYPSAKPETVAMVKEQIEQYIHFDKVIETTAGCTVACHCGPYTLGILFIRSK